MKTLTEFTLLIATAGLLFFGSGCQTDPHYKQGFDFSHYRTFAILPLPTTGTYRDPSIITRLGPPARQAAEQTLSGKGFKQVPQSEADFNVRILFAFLHEGEEDHGEQRNWEIQIVDVKSNEVVWSAWRSRTTRSTMPPEAVQKVVADMLKPFPPGTK